MRKPISILTVCLLPAMIAACAGEKAARQMASTGAGLVNDLSVQTQEFFKGQDSLNQSITSSIAYRNADTTLLTNQSVLQRGAWLAQNNRASIEIYDALSVNTSAALLASDIDLNTLSASATKSPVTVDPKSFDDLTATLKKLATKPSLKERASFLFSEGKAVYDGYNQTLKEAGSTTQSATAKTANTK